MTKQEALSWFDGNGAALGRALGITRYAVWKWPDDQPIPALREKQMRYEIIPKLKRKKAKK